MAANCVCSVLVGVVVEGRGKDGHRAQRHQRGAQAHWTLVSVCLFISACMVHGCMCVWVHVCMCVWVYVCVWVAITAHSLCVFFPPTRLTARSSFLFFSLSSIIF